MEKNRHFVEETQIIYLLEKKTHITREKQRSLGNNMLHLEGNTYHNGKKSQVNIIVKNDNQMQDSGENTQKN